MSTSQNHPQPAWAQLSLAAMSNGDEYDVEAYTPDLDRQRSDYALRSEQARQAPDVHWQTISYADHPLAVADVFRPARGPVRGTVVFVHGGYWKGQGRPSRAFLAPGWTAAGVQWVNLGYPVAPETSMATLSNLARDAMHDLLAARGPLADAPGPVVLSGNSAGAHLVAHALAQPLQGAAASRLAGSMLLSGLYDLEPLVHLPQREWMRLDTAGAIALSPARQPAPSLQAPVLVTVGADEPGAFIAQSRLYARHLLGHAPVDYLEVPGGNHLSMIAKLESPQAVLGSIVARWLGLQEH